MGKNVVSPSGNLISGPSKNVILWPGPHPPLMSVSGRIGRPIGWTHETPWPTRRGRMTRRVCHYPRTWRKVYGQGYRVANDSLALYELYLGEDAMPDFAGVGQPVETSATLPLTHTPSLPGAGLTTVLHIITRRRNRYGLLSHNQHPSLIEIDEFGEEVLGPITDPEILRIFDGDEGEIIVTARYPRDTDRNPADTWELYVEAGVDPDPDVDTAKSTIAFGMAGGVDWNWRVSCDSLTPGTVYHVMVCAVRDGDADYRGESAVVQHTVAEMYDIDAGGADLFGGQEYELGL